MLNDVANVKICGSTMIGSANSSALCGRAVKRVNILFWPKSLHYFRNINNTNQSEDAKYIRQPEEEARKKIAFLCLYIWQENRPKCKRL